MSLFSHIFKVDLFNHAIFHSVCRPQPFSLEFESKFERVRGKWKLNYWAVLKALMQELKRGF